MNRGTAAYCENLVQAVRLTHSLTCDKANVNSTLRCSAVSLFAEQDWLHSGDTDAFLTGQLKVRALFCRRLFQLHPDWHISDSCSLDYPYGRTGVYKKYSAQPMNSTYKCGGICNHAVLPPAPAPICKRADTAGQHACWTFYKNFIY